MSKKMTAGIVAFLMALTAVIAVSLDRVVLRAQAGESMATLYEAMDLVHDRFVGEYQEEEMLDAALNGMVNGLGDRWSHYLTREEYNAVEERRTNRYVGIGVAVGADNPKGLLVREVVAGGPAEKAGLTPGDIITAVDGLALTGEEKAARTEAIRGEAGTEVMLELLRKDGTTCVLKVVRAEVEDNPVHSELRADGIGYVHLENFYEHSAERLNQAVADLQAQGARALLFDMRGNGGGYVTELTQMLDYLLPEGPIFISRDKAGREEITRSDAACVDLPMGVLVNGDTYSAAEFFAAQLQETAGAVVVGEPTSGKGFSQQMFRMPNGGALSISTAAYRTGAGRSLIGTGVDLDLEVSPEGTEDRPLQEAVKLLQKEIS